MTIQEGPPIDPHPEGLTGNQEVLAGMLFETKQIAPVTRRITQSDGSLKFEKVERPTSPIEFAQEGEFALKLHEKDPHAPLSPIYINLRNLPYRVLDQVGRVLTELGADRSPDFCTGIPKAGSPLAKAYAIYSGMLYMGIYEKEEMGNGRKIVSGEYVNIKGKKVRLIDDVATSGETKFEAIKAAEEMGCRVVDILVLVDRQQSATKQLREAGYALKAAFTLDQLLRYGLRTGRISAEQYNQVKEYLSLQAA